MKTGVAAAGMKYCCEREIVYFSKRYGKTVTVPAGYLSDGASGPAVDISSRGWWVHDMLCDVGRFDDGTRCTNWQASRVLSDILKEEGRKVRSVTWLWATFFFGQGAARQNGMVNLKPET